MLLTHQQLQELSGYKTRRCQIKWLALNGVRYLVGADGHPRVLIDHIASLLGAKTHEAPSIRTRPNLDALEQYQRSR